MQPKNSKTICIFNQAGGQAKTTLCFNLGYHLRQRDKTVLLIDMDGQASLTKQVDLIPKKLQVTISDALLGKQAIPIHEIELGMDVVPSNGSMYSLDLRLGMERIEAPALLLRKILEPIQPSYDYILIDCPPSAGLSSYNALIAASHILIPIECNDKGMEGIDELVGNVEEVVTQGHKTLSFVGVVPVKAKRKQLKTEETLKDIYRYFSPFTKVFTPIPHRTDFEHAWAAHVPLAAVRPDSEVLSAFEEIIDHMETL
ncbi:MAG: ParA family protein [Leptolyngbya sp. SIOISBB]|nr:ParA family protein [Leptolyngbya sp. SIOISBB]